MRIVGLQVGYDFLLFLLLLLEEREREVLELTMPEREGMPYG